MIRETRVIFFFMVVLVVLGQGTEGPELAYLPFVGRRAVWESPAGVWMDVQAFGRYADELAYLPVKWLRIQWVHAGETMYTAWKRGGWQELDARFGPLMAKAEELGLLVYLNVMWGGECGVIPDRGELARYGSFVTQAADRYSVIKRVSPWNEWDYGSGEKEYFGCFGRKNWQEYLYLLSQVTPRRALVVAEYGFSVRGTQNYLRLVEGYADEIAIHHYGVYLKDVVYIWPGTAAQALELAKEHTDLRVLLTETSVREPSETLCLDGEFQRRQAEVNLETLREETPLVIFFNYGSRWECTNIRGTVFHTEWSRLK
jgi:hypothetical protein